MEDPGLHGKVKRRGLHPKGWRVEATLITGGLVLAMTVLAIWQGGAVRAGEGFLKGAELALAVLPQVTLGFALAGLITVVVPSDLIARWIGETSGTTGLLVATLAGVLTPGGPFFQFPLVAALQASGAGVGPLAAYLTAWSLLGLNRAIVWELPLLGPQFTAVRWGISVLVPLVVGLLTPPLMRAMTR